MLASSIGVKGGNRESLLKGYASSVLQDEKVLEICYTTRFHSNPKVRECQRMFKLLHNCIHFTH